MQKYFGSGAFWQTFFEIFILAGKRDVSTSQHLMAITFRLPKELLNRLAEVADGEDISRQKLVTLILQKAIDDKSFTIEIARD